MFLLVALMSAQPNATRACPEVPPNTLELPEAEFDQDGTKGWRPLARPGCFLKAAALIEGWRARHPGHGHMLPFHEAQMRAAGGDYRGAEPLFLRARSSPNEWRVDTGWNDYVAASAAFVRRDLPALKAVRARLAVLPIPSEQPGAADAAKREPHPDVWPPNLDVVDALIRCFDKPYADAMGPDCRAPKP